MNKAGIPLQTTPFKIASSPFNALSPLASVSAWVAATEISPMSAKGIPVRGCRFYSFFLNFCNEVLSGNEMGYKSRYVFVIKTIIPFQALIEKNCRDLKKKKKKYQKFSYNINIIIQII
jgi:hypothetical protein